jgi:hypothetical protein
MAGTATARCALRGRLLFKQRRDIASLVEKIMKTRTFVLALATAVAIASGPQLAHAACSGDACNYVYFTDKTAFKNTHRTNTMVIGLCVLDNHGSCGNSPRIEELNIQPMQSKELPKWMWTSNVELRFAKFIPDRSTPGPNR